MNGLFLKNLVIVFIFAMGLSLFNAAISAESSTGERVRRIVLIAGVKSHGPGEHEYLKSIRLLKVLLDRAPNLKGIRTEIYFDGWPEDPSVLDRANTVAFFSSGDDGNSRAPFTTDERISILERQMKRGCGFVTFHFSTFAPQKYAAQMLEWTGGYFDFQTGNGEGRYYWGPGNEGSSPTWRSSIKVTEADVQIATPHHPVARGVSQFHLRDEFYYQLVFREKDRRLKPILRVPSLSSVRSDQTVAWAVQRQDGGRGFGTTNGHYFDNWQNDAFRKLILNALVWTAGAEVPKDGVESHYLTELEVNRFLMSDAIPTLLIDRP